MQYLTLKKLNLKCKETLKHFFYVHREMYSPRPIRTMVPIPTGTTYLPPLTSRYPKIPLLGRLPFNYKGSLAPQKIQ